MILGMVWRFDTMNPGDCGVHRLRFGRLDIRNLAAQAGNLACSGNSRFRRINSRFGLFNSRFGRKTSRLLADGNSPASACFRTFFSLRIEDCMAEIAKIPGYFRFFGNLADRGR